MTLLLPLYSTTVNFKGAVGPLKHEGGGDENLNLTAMEGYFNSFLQTFL